MKKKKTVKKLSLFQKLKKRKPYYFGKIKLKKLDVIPDLYTVYAGPADCGPYGEMTGCLVGQYED